LEDAAATYAKLAAAHPGDTSYLFEAARLEAVLHQYASARSRLTSLLAVEPDNLDARLLLAQLELKQGQSASALRQFERVLAQRPADLEALEGAARAHYYTGDLGQAYELASRLVEQEPGNFDALFLLASIERARGQRYEARLLLNRADRISPHNSDVKELREKVWQESSTVLHLTAAYNREITSPEPGVPPSEVVEDLRTFAFGSRLDFVRLPRTTSSFLFDFLPVETPLGFYGGAAAPYEFLYQQTTHVFSKLALRGGIGFQHFGPGVPVNLPNGAGPQPSATSAVVGFGGGTFALTRHVSFDFTWNRSGITYTPLAVRLGVISSRTEEGLGVAFDPRTTLHLTYFQERLTTEPYTQVVSTGTTGNPMTVTSSEYENGSGGTAVFSRLIVNRERLVLDVGGSALLFGYDGPRRGVFLGFFTPSFYQRELFDSRVKGRLSKTFGYDVSASFGVQQVNQGQPIKHALILSPGFTFKLTPYLSGSIGYTHYDAAQSLGLVQGNGVHLGIDWRF
jgi:hypothetical protein